MVSMIIAAGGSSRRFGADNKLLQPLAGMPVFLHSVQRFAPLCAELVLVIPEELRREFEEALADCPVRTAVKIVNGGNCRSGSVRNGLAALSPDTGYVAIHDAARPLASEQLLAKLVEAASGCDGAVPGLRMTDTVKEISGGRVAGTLDRDALVTVQTPQLFDCRKLRAAYAAAGDRSYTDDAAVMEAFGGSVAFVENPEPNFKITFAADLDRAAELMRVRSHS